MTPHHVTNAPTASSIVMDHAKNTGNTRKNATNYI